jgi:hypothetical protein
VTTGVIREGAGRPALPCVAKASLEGAGVMTIARYSRVSPKGQLLKGKDDGLQYRGEP